MTDGWPGLGLTQGTNKTDPTAMQQYNNVNVLLNQENGSNSLTVIP